jgi:cytochrome P450
VFLPLSNGNYGIILSEGTHWEQQRRFTLRKLRDVGFAKSTMESLILDEVNGMCKWFEKRLDKPMSGIRIFNGAVVNALWNIVSGERSEWDAPEPPELIKRVESLMGSIHKLTASGVVYAPILRFILPEATGWNGWLKNIDRVTEMTQASVQRHAQELDPNNPQDLIDHYLIEMQNETDPKSSFYKENGDKNLKAAIPDLFIAGSETTSHTLSWTMLFLAHNPRVQKKLQNELDVVVGQIRQPLLSDRANLPYTEAVIMETLRRSALVTNGVPHKMLEDKVINGYFFPKNATIMSNLYQVNNDPKVWGDPEIYRPERFLTPDGSNIVKHDSYMPFSLGRRQCLGMSLANDTLFLFTSAIFQRFYVKPDPTDDGNALNKIRPTTKMINDPEPFRIIVSQR